MFVKVIIVGIALCVINIFLRKYASEFILPLEIIFIALVTVSAVDYLKSYIFSLSETLNRIQYGEEIFVSLVKGLSVCLITKFSADICRESGNELISDIVELSGRIMLFIFALPYIESIMKIALAFLK